METTQEFNCVFCETSFDNKEELKTHFRKHGDPTFDHHAKNKIRPSNESKNEKKLGSSEMVSCDVCSELFPTISKAITHKHKMHPDHDAKYFCPWCGKLFTMKHLYNKHLEANHDNVNENDKGSFNCDCCEVNFHIPSAMLYHNKFFHRQDTDLPSVGQCKKLKMFNQEVLQIYYCAFCGEEYNNKVNLCKHIEDDHSDENQNPEEVLRCPLCDAIFYHLDAYELHLTFHSTEDMYSEKNEMADSITEFSLEAVPPLMEKVESEEQYKESSENQVMGIDDFLQLAMDNPESEGSTKVKVKKHKKHKKSKKPAITLDEFLNMNSDVFGEGLDFQGIEEVPSRVVAKRLKVKKTENSKKVSKLPPKEVEKLRKQGVVVKMKPGKKPLKKDSLASNTDKLDTSAKSNVVKASSDVLSKLMNQSNSQIKIVRKSIQNSDNSLQTKNSDDELKQCSPKNREHECDMKRNLSEPRLTEQSNEKVFEEKSNFDIISEHSKQHVLDSNNVKADDILDKSNKEYSPLPDVCGLNSVRSEMKDDVERNNVCQKSKDSDTLMTANNHPLSALRNVSQHITIKSVGSSKTKPLLDISDTKSNDIHSFKNDEHFTEQSENDSKESLSALKYLGQHITVKSISQKRNTTLDKNHDKTGEVKNELEPSVNSDEEFNSNEIDDTPQSDQEAEEHIITKKRLYTDETKDFSIKSMDTLKSIGKNVTVKSFTQSTESSGSNFCNSRGNDIDDIKNETYVKTENQTVYHNKNPTMLKSPSLERTPAAAIKSPAVSPKIVNTTISSKFTRKESSPLKEDIDKSQSNANLLKHLTNITAKAIGGTKSLTTNKCTTESIHEIQNNPIQRKEETNNIIEILDIDSDSENDDHQSSKKTIEAKTVADEESRSLKNVSSKPVDALKNLSKQITIKSSHQSTHSVNKRDNDHLSSESEIDKTEMTVRKKNFEKFVTNEKEKALQNTLKHLSKHITVKSRNSSPSSIATSRDHRENIQNSESDSDSNQGHVKISEVGDDHDFREQDDEYNENVVVQSPDSGSLSNNDNCNDEDIEEEFSDIENKIRVNTVKRSNLNLQSENDSLSSHNLKNIGRDVTIKSLNEKKPQSEVPVPTTRENTSLPNHLKEVSIKPLKQPIKKSQERNEVALNSSNKTAGQQIKRFTNQALNQNVSTTSNQTNTVNKEITVKTFQSKTVIQEITTTVTKTIKTVNQTVNQEVQSTNSPVKFQKVQGMKPKQAMNKSYQGVVVRHASPSMGTKVQNAMTPVRPASNPVKTSNQLVAVRPGVHITRPNIPKPSAINNTLPVPVLNNAQKKVPSTVTAATKKRTTPQEQTGPFSCFKKPKESLIPGSDIPTISSSDEGENAIYFASSSQMSKSNIMNMTKTVKGNTVTSSQMKSEVNVCSQQLSRLNKVSGLKVVKTSQVKQVAQIEENVEVSAAKRTALEAIEKLQKQGLLVKKSRQNEDSEHSDDEMGNLSHDENEGYSE